MTPKEKAEELINKYRKFPATVPYTDLEGSRDGAVGKMTNYSAKQCALIATDEIILSNPHSNPLNTDVYSTMDYWQKVRTEIEKL